MSGLEPERVEPTPRRIRVRLGDRLVADSTRALLLIQYGPGGLPTYFLPRDDVAPTHSLTRRVARTGSRGGASAPVTRGPTARPGPTRTRSWEGT